MPVTSIAFAIFGMASIIYVLYKLMAIIEHATEVKEELVLAKDELTQVKAALALTKDELTKVKAVLAITEGKLIVEQLSRLDDEYDTLSSNFDRVNNELASAQDELASAQDECTRLSESNILLRVISQFAYSLVSVSNTYYKISDITPHQKDVLLSVFDVMTTESDAPINDFVEISLCKWGSESWLLTMLFIRIGTSGIAYPYELDKIFFKWNLDLQRKQYAILCIELQSNRDICQLDESCELLIIIGAILFALDSGCFDLEVESADDRLITVLRSSLSLEPSDRLTSIPPAGIAILLGVISDASKYNGLQKLLDDCKMHNATKWI